MGSSRVQVCFSERGPAAEGGGVCSNSSDIGSLSQEPRQSDASSSERSGKRRGRREKGRESRRKTTRKVASSQRKQRKRTQINGFHVFATLEMKCGPRWHRCRTEVLHRRRIVIGQHLAVGGGEGKGRGSHPLTEFDERRRTETSDREAPPSTVNFLAYWRLMSQFVARNMLTCSAL